MRFWDLSCCRGSTCGDPVYSLHFLASNTFLQRQIYRVIADGVEGGLLLLPSFATSTLSTRARTHVPYSKCPYPEHTVLSDGEQFITHTILMSPKNVSIARESAGGHYVEPKDTLLKYPLPLRTHLLSKLLAVHRLLWSTAGLPVDASAFL